MNYLKLFSACFDIRTHKTKDKFTIILEITISNYI